MKTKKIRIAIIEDGNFYNNIIRHQISDLMRSRDNDHIRFDIISTTNANELLNKSKPFQIVIFDHHFKNNKQQIDYNVSELMDKIKSFNNECFFISISGYREMNISAFLYKCSELVFTYSKQSANRNENYEEKCSIPSLHKLMEKFIDMQLCEMQEMHQLKAA